MTAKIRSGTRVKIKDVGLLPSIRWLVGREGVTERPEDEGCYVKFSENTYMFCFWAEMEVVA